MSPKFVHLHVHTEYSLLDGLSKISDLVSYIKKEDMKSVAITDHGAMYGVIEFYKKCKKEGIKPIIGMEAYTTNVDLKERPSRGKIKNNHLLLLAKDRQGYENLMKLTCTSACPQGELAQTVFDGNFEGARKLTKWFLDVFGEDYYFEIQKHEYAKFIDKADNDEVRNLLIENNEFEEKINKGIIELSRELGIPLVATNDAHYIRKNDASAQDALVCIATGKKVTDLKRLRYIDSPTFYLKTEAEMRDLFKDYPDALKNTWEVSEKCNVEIELNRWFFPKYDLPEKKTADSVMEEKLQK